MTSEETQDQFALAEKLIAEQNFTTALIAGTIAAMLAAIAYGIVVTLWRFSYDFAFAGIGIVVGLTMQYLGRGVSTKFSLAAGALTVLGCLLGYFSNVVISMSAGSSRSPVDVLRDNSLSVLADRATGLFDLVHLVYWFVAVIFAVMLVRRPLSRSDRLAIGLYERKSAPHEHR